MSVQRRRVLVSGRVQGVWFRQSCAEQARLQGVTGWIRNRPGGDVEAVFEGERSGVEAMVAWCRHGPVRAAVSQVQITAEEPEGFTGFSVKGWA